MNLKCRARLKEFSLVWKSLLLNINVAIMLNKHALDRLFRDVEKTLL